MLRIQSEAAEELGQIVQYLEHRGGGPQAEMDANAQAQRPRRFLAGQQRRQLARRLDRRQRILEGRQDALSRERARCTDINVVRVYSCQQRVGCGPDAHREFSEGNAAVLKPRRIIKRNWNERVSRLGAPDAKLHQGEVLGWNRRDYTKWLYLARGAGSEASGVSEAGTDSGAHYTATTRGERSICR